MNKYNVTIKRILINKIEVDADSKRDAHRKVKETINSSKLLETDIMNISKPQIVIKTKKI